MLCLVAGHENRAIRYNTMRVNVLVKPNSRKKKIEKLPDGSYQIFISAPARDGLANEAVIESLSEFLSLPKSRVQILKGLHSKKKIVEIVD